MNWSVVATAGLVVLLVGVNTLLWSAVGVGRMVHALSTRGRGIDRAPAPPIEPRHVAVIVAAHNEQLVIMQTLTSAAVHVRPDQIFVASDGSTDDTADIARRFGANVLELSPNRGKAGAIVAAVEHFCLVDRFDVVVLLDADTVLSPDYLATGLPYFTDPEVVAVAGRAATIADPRPTTLIGRLLVNYRERVYVVVQFLVKFGQAARGANVVSIVPGFASMYRSQVLDKIDISAPGFTIEDYNMTFEIHSKSLGRIAFHPHAAVAYTQDPDTLHDYARQVGRWSLGFWQTVLRHRWRARPFWFSLGLYIFELVLGGVMLVVFLPLLAVTVAATIITAGGTDTSGVSAAIASALPPQVLLIGVLLPDYLLTVVAAVITRRPAFLLFGLAFPLVRILDAAICLRRLPQALLGGSTGTWTSPSRRGTVPDAH
ncbi:glycosyltransferase family 2 protein [Nakamurella silvestris]|nr:glycosyltransferase family 2 protein [Nakamurella silvestris]